MYKDNVESEPEARASGRGPLGRVFNAVWRIMGRVWFTGRGSRLSATPFFGRIAGQIAEEETSETGGPRTPQLPKAEISDEERREALKDYSRKPRA